MNIYRDETVALVEKHTAMMKYNVILLKRRKKLLIWSGFLMLSNT